MKTTTGALALTLSLGLLAAPALAETDWTVTGPKGGLSTGSTDCSRADGAVTCQGAGTYTSPNGKVYQRKSTASGDRSGGQRVITTTGPNGKSATVTRSWSRN